MKVLVMYENSAEMDAAINLAAVLNKAGSMLANASILGNGSAMRIEAGPQWKVEAGVAPVEAVPPPRPIVPHSNTVPDLIFEED